MDGFKNKFLMRDNLKLWFYVTHYTINCYVLASNLCKFHFSFYHFPRTFSKNHQKETLMPDNEQVYEIGLVMAGAVSAGAYTAGVVDYLFEALMHYEKVREKFAQENPGKALHNVQIKVMSGASAGGMTGSMALSAMMDESYSPMSGYHPNTVTESDILNNVFYKSWVSGAHGIDIKYMLDTSDVTGKAPLKSLLNCDRLDQIADSAFKRPRVLQKWDFIPNRIEHFLSVFNLGGVPYALKFDATSSQYALANHSDMMHFVCDRDPSAKYEKNDIPVGEDKTSTLNPNWTLLRTATLATGAFPIALEYRDVKKDRDSYNEWKWWVPNGGSKDNTKDACGDKGRCFSLTNISPDWCCAPKEGYGFVAVDGGVANNEPLEVARRALAGDDLFNPRGADEVTRSIIMVDPFPSTPLESFDYENKTLIDIAGKLFGALKEQARFKPEEITLAANPNIFSRYMIAPSRDGAEPGCDLASASVGAFGGFLSEKFRQHDFQLGRKNCQSFLKNYFTVGLGNSLVRDNIEWFRQNGCIVKKDETEYVQVVPMIGLPDYDITKDIEPIDFGSIAMSQEELGDIKSGIENRVKTIVEKSFLLKKVLDGKVNNPLIAPFKWLFVVLFGGLISSKIASSITELIYDKIEKDLRTRKLLKV